MRQPPTTYEARPPDGDRRRLQQAENPDRNRGSKRIDGIVASIMGLAREAMRDGFGGSVYNTRGPLVVDF